MVVKQLKMTLSFVSKLFTSPLNIQCIRYIVSYFSLGCLLLKFTQFPVEAPIEMTKIEEKIEVISSSNDGDNATRDDVLVKLTNETIADKTTAPSKSNVPHTNSMLFDSNAQNMSISIPLKSIQKDKQQRPNKLSRSRPSTNQQKAKPSNSIDISLMSLDTRPALKMNETHSKRHPQISSTGAIASTSTTTFQPSSYASTTITLAQSIPSTSYAHHSSTNGTSSIPFISSLQNPPRHPAIASTSQTTTPTTSTAAAAASRKKPNRADAGAKQHIQDGTTKLTVVQPAPNSATAGNTNSFEPELVLSPANLGQ